MKKLFTNDKFFLMVTILSIVCMLYCSTLGFISNPKVFVYFLSTLVSASCIAVLYISYKKRSKNVMKGMMGAELMMLFMKNLFLLELDYGAFDHTMTIILQIILTALFISHFVINSNRKSSPYLILFNQILCVLYGIVAFADAIYFFVADVTIMDKIGDIVLAIISFCTPSVIVCVESRLDAYRQYREAAGWTPEKGYPEGYVHEYEKKK